MKETLRKSAFLPDPRETTSPGKNYVQAGFLTGLFVAGGKIPGKEGTGSLKLPPGPSKCPLEGKEFQDMLWNLSILGLPTSVRLVRSNCSHLHGNNWVDRVRNISRCSTLLCNTLPRTIQSLLDKSCTFDNRFDNQGQVLHSSVHYS